MTPVLHDLANRRTAKPRALLWGVAAIAPPIVLAAWLGASLLQRQLPFLEAAPGTPQAAGLVGFRDATIATADDQRLDAWWAPPPAPGRGAVLFLHGNPGTLASTAGHLADLRRSGLGAMAIDYRGFGRSTGHPSQRGLRLDADAAFDWLRRAAPRSRIAVFGESLGTYPAVALACDRPVAGVLLNAPFASLRRLWIIHGLPSERWLASDPFDSAVLIGRIDAPLMILEGSADATVLPREALRLYAAARPPKTMIMVRGAGHVAAYRGDAKARALAALVRWTGGSDAGH
jgi:uncharacterized protein